MKTLDLLPVRLRQRPDDGRILVIRDVRQSDGSWNPQVLRYDGTWQDRPQGFNFEPCDGFDCRIDYVQERLSEDLSDD